MFGLWKGEPGTTENVRQNGEPDNRVPAGMVPGEPVTDLGIPIGVFPGYMQGNFIIQALPGGVSGMKHPGPTTFARYNMSRGVHDVQLQNGLRDKIAAGLIIGYPGEGYLNEIEPQMPGQSRLIGQNSGPQNFTPRGGSPSQWQNIVNAKMASDSNFNGSGAPGTLGGNLIYMGQSGG